MAFQMHIQVELIDSAVKWNQEIMKYPYVTYFHSWEWGKLTASTFGWKFRPYKMISSSRVFYCGVFATPTGLFAGPIGYGGILTELQIRPSHDEWLAAIRVLEETEHQLFQQIIFPPLFQETPEYLLGKRSIRETSMITLPSDRSTLWSETFTGTARTSVRAAAKRGVQINQSNDPTFVESIYSIYQETANRVQFGYQTPCSLIKALVSQGSEHVWFLVATYNDEPIAWHLFFHFGLTVVHWITAYQYEWKDLRANAALLDSGFSLAIERKAKFFNLGRSHTPQQVITKSSWGAQLHPYYVYARS